MCVYVCMHVYVWGEKERGSEGGTERGVTGVCTCGM